MPIPVSAAGNGVATPVAPTTPPGLLPNPPFVLPQHANLDTTTLDGAGSVPINFKNIQGNILGGFNKDFQTMLFLHFTDPVKGRAWLAHMARNVSSSDDVLAFNNLFKLLRARHGREGMVQATWTNIAFTHSGLTALGATGLSSFPQAFKDGMAARAALLSDVGASAPAHWVGGANTALGSHDIHAVLIVASDIEDEVDPTRDPLAPNATVAGYIQNFGFNGAVKLLYTQQGRTRLDIRDAQGHTPQAGHEHFGFKDGVSQPGVRGVDTSQAVNCDGKPNPDQGNNGQDLLHPGEFVLGYPTQIPAPAPGVDGPNPNPGPISQSGPAWTADGSYLVFRRLRQDVQGFKNEVAQRAPALAQALGLPHGTDATDLMGAKLVGRYASGCPLEKLNCQTGAFTPSAVDPGKADPSLGNDDQKNNFFEYGDDPLGLSVPRGSHIRKAYPRDEELFPGGGGTSESNTQTHRLLRRGIPFGPSLGAAVGGGASPTFPHDRGLLFLCYQTDLERQFEFVQTQWINNAGFPCPLVAGLKDSGGALVYPNGTAGPDGEDPVIAQTASGPYAIPTSATASQRLPNLKHFVTMTGGDYFFSPSLPALFQIAQVGPPA